MKTEIEAKWLDVSHDDMRQKLKACGATLITPERLMTRAVFDYEDRRLQKIGGWVRVRDEGDKITLSYKQLNNRTLYGTKEINLVVDDFDKTCDFLESIGLKRKSYQETKRESWKLGNTEIELDTWPWIPTFIEIEAPNETTLRKIATELNLDYTKALHGSVEPAYQAIYDVTEEEINNWPEIKFSDTPDWLMKRAK